MPRKEDHCPPHDWNMVTSNYRTRTDSELCTYLLVDYDYECADCAATQDGGTYEVLLFCLPGRLK